MFNTLKRALVNQAKLHCIGTRRCRQGHAACDARSDQAQISRFVVQTESTPLEKQPIRFRSRSSGLWCAAPGPGRGPGRGAWEEKEGSPQELGSAREAPQKVGACTPARAQACVQACRRACAPTCRHAGVQLCWCTGGLAGWQAGGRAGGQAGGHARACSLAFQTVAVAHKVWWRHQLEGVECTTSGTLRLDA